MNQFHHKQPLNCLTIDVEDWFHILDSPAAPSIDSWDSLESRVERNLNLMLEVLDRYSVKATFFWLGWVAQRHNLLVRRCIDLGHEVASHGQSHVLAYKVGPEAFRRDIADSKGLLEDITGCQVRGFRAPGFGVKDDSPWTFEVIRQVGFEYDASVFPARRGHGGMPGSKMKPYLIQTKAGELVECPMSVVSMFGQRLCLFSGGYLRISPIWLIRWGIEHIHKCGRPLIILIHPREVDPSQPRLPLSRTRKFKSYVNLKSTQPKLEWLCGQYSFSKMNELAQSVIRAI